MDNIQETIISEDKQERLYERFKDIAPGLINETSPYLSYETGSDRDHTFVIAFDQETNIIDMYHVYEIEGREVMDPHMQFEFDIENNEIVPFYFNNPIVGLEYDLHNGTDPEFETELYDYAIQWLGNIKQKGYYIESEQIYKDERITTSSILTILLFHKNNKMKLPYLKRRSIIKSLMTILVQELQKKDIETI